MHQPSLAALLFASSTAFALPAAAQEERLAVSAGVRAWATSWSTFTYFPPMMRRRGLRVRDDRPARMKKGPAASPGPSFIYRIW